MNERRKAWLVKDFVGYCEKLESVDTIYRLLRVFETAMDELGYANVAVLQWSEDTDDISLPYSAVLAVGVTPSQHIELDRAVLNTALRCHRATVVKVSTDQRRLIHSCSLTSETLGNTDETCIALRGSGSGNEVAFVFATKTAEAEASLMLVDGVAASFYSRFLSLKSSNRPDTFLTEKETQTLKMIATGLTKKDIATEQGVTCHAIDFHYRNILKKYRTKRMLVAVVKAVRGGLV